MLIVNERWAYLKMRIKAGTWRRIKETAQRCEMSTSAVVHRYPGHLPRRLQPLAASCFVATRREWLEARRAELSNSLRSIDRELKKTAGNAPTGAVRQER